MLTIEHCDNVHLHLPNQGMSLLSEALAEGLRKQARAEMRADGPLQTSASTHLQPPGLGELWPGQGGRYVATMPARNGKPAYHLLLAEQQGESLKFGPYDHDVTGAVDHWDGLANTAALCADREKHPAADWANNLGADGHEDFYLPAHAEICQLWINVPQLFKTEGYYWSSTQYSPDFAWVQDFEDGSSHIYYKGNEFRAVAVRRLIL